MRDTLVYHTSRRDFHQREAEKWQNLLAQATASEELRKERKPEAAPVKGNGRDSRAVEPTKKPQSIVQFVENAIVSSGILGVTAMDIRKQAKNSGVHVATNFPYRQASRMIGAGKVWKDSSGRYYHTSFVPEPKDSISAQETSH